jgi:hypothetical protein
MISDEEQNASTEEFAHTGEDLGGALAAGGEKAPAAQAEERTTKSLREELQEQLKASQSRQRDDQGRFVKGELSPTTPASIEQQTPAAAAPATTTTPPAQKHQPPTSWSAQAKAEFDRLPAPVQEAIAKREQEVHKGFTAQDEHRTLGKQVSEAVQPFTAVISAEGRDAVSAFKSFLNTAYLLRSGTAEAKLALVKNMCARYSIPLDGLTAQLSAQPTTPLPQPQPQGLSREEVAELVRQEQRQASLQTQVEAFANDPANRYFEQVRQHMSALLLQGLASDLKDAYEQACWANPNVRSSLEAERIKAETEQRETGLRQKSAAAKHASGSVRGSPGASTPTQARSAERSLRDEIAANLRAAQSGAI